MEAHQVGVVEEMRMNNQLLLLEEEEEEEEEAEEEVARSTDHHHHEFIVTPSLDGLEEILEYKFNDQNLLQEAYIHASLYYPDKTRPTYERLEFIGDSVLNTLIAKKLFLDYPHLPPGPLTRLRAANVDNEKLARVAIKLGLHRFLSHKNHQFVEQIRDFSAAIIEYPIHSNGLIDTPKFLADIVESTIGAIFVDSNFSPEVVWKVSEKLLEPIINLETLGTHPVTELFELCQMRGSTVKIVKNLYKLENSTTAEVLVDGVSSGSFTYKNGDVKKDIAQAHAAKKALDYLKQALLLAADDDE